MYTPEQVARRNASPWTRVQIILAPAQFLAFIVSFALVVRYLATGEGYGAATVSVWVKIALIWAITITGMLWEKDVYGHYFMAREFFWEDFGNLVAILTHNAYFVVQWLGWNQRDVMVVMLVAYLAYLFNATQFVIKGIRSARQRRAMRLQTTVNE
ncbi:MAG: 2-vinyl bacteriochlorophyllide hydratase [Chloroflexaceae bacterium]|nr:2-vinyl bacteriochlorophyllide hydratase [Chloroflexaceae bacterium]